MSEIIDCDPSKGFVAFPVAVFDLDLSPGAFRTLAELCRMANSIGQCWPSLAQLGRRLGRSRAAVSGYVTELRAAGVLSTEEQKMANGYNYRLRYTVTFWKEWRAGLGRSKTPSKPAQTIERSIQPSERPLRTINQIHIKQHESGEIAKLISDWKGAVGKAPYPGFSSWPSEVLVAKSKATSDQLLQPDPLISADIERALRQFCVARGLTGPKGEVSDQLCSFILTREGLDQMISALSDSWQPHWKKPPNTYQLIRLVTTLPALRNIGAEQKLLKSYLRRWKLHMRSLPSPAIHSKVAR